MTSVDEVMTTIVQELRFLISKLCLFSAKWRYLIWFIAIISSFFLTLWNIMILQHKMTQYCMSMQLIKRDQSMWFTTMQISLMFRSLLIQTIITNEKEYAYRCMNSTKRLVIKRDFSWKEWVNISLLMQHHLIAMKLNTI